MASPVRLEKTLTLDEFLRLPEIDEHPYLEYIDGRIEAKVSPHVSPQQSLRKCREKLDFSMQNGCPLGWLIDPVRKTVDVYRAGVPIERLPADGVIDGDAVMPGYRLGVSELFGWLRRTKPNSPSAPTQAAPGESTQ